MIKRQLAVLFSMVAVGINFLTFYDSWIRYTETIANVTLATREFGFSVSIVEHIKSTVHVFVNVTPMVSSL